MAHKLTYIIVMIALLTGVHISNITGLATGQIYPPWECGITGQIIEEDPFEVDPGNTQDPFRFQKEIQQRNFDYRNGCEIGTVLGSAQGISDGYNDRIAEREANPSNNYVSPSETDLCVLFEDFYETRCVLPSNSSQIILNFVQGYLGAFPVAYNAGYYAGYSLDKVVDQRYQLLDGIGSVNAETVLGPTAEREQEEEEDANISTDGGNDNSSRYSRWWSPY